MIKRLLQTLGVSIVSFIGGGITGYFVLLPIVTSIIPDPFYAGVISGATGFMTWYFVLEVSIIWLDSKTHKPN